jgi:preprotein translocase subunit YajC
MFVTPAFAQAGQTGGPEFFTSFIMPLLIVVLIMYFLVIRPQQRKAKQLRDMIASVRRGDTVVTGGGIVGKVTRVVDDNEVQVEIADGVRVKLMRSSITDIPIKGKPKEGAKKS